MKIAICDDEHDFVLKFKDMLNKYSSWHFNVERINAGSGNGKKMEATASWNKKTTHQVNVIDFFWRFL